MHPSTYEGAYGDLQMVLLWSCAEETKSGHTLKTKPLPCPYRQLWVSFLLLNQICPGSYNQINSFCKSAKMNITEEDEKRRLFTPLKITQNKFTWLLLASPQSGQTFRWVRVKILTRIFSTMPMTQCSATGHQNFRKNPSYGKITETSTYCFGEGILESS